MLSFSFVATPHERVICSLQFLHFHSVPGCVLPTPGFPIGIVWWSPYSVLNLFEFSSWAACPCLSWDASFNSLQAFCWPCIAPLSAPSPLCWLMFTHWPLCWMLDSIPPPYPLIMFVDSWISNSGSVSTSFFQLPAGWLYATEHVANPITQSSRIQISLTLYTSWDDPTILSGPRIDTLEQCLNPFI